MNSGWSKARRGRCAHNLTLLGARIAKAVRQAAGEIICVTRLEHRNLAAEIDLESTSDYDAGFLASVTQQLNAGVSTRGVMLMGNLKRTRLLLRGYYSQRQPGASHFDQLITPEKQLLRILQIH